MIDSKQFILCDKIVKLNAGWESIRLSSGKYLSWDKKLNVIYNGNHNSVLIGDAWQVTGGGVTPDEIIKEWSPSPVEVKDVINIEKNWCGRYILIIDNNIYTDATAMLQIFYDDMCVTSSISVLRKVENRDLKYPKLIYGIGPDFIPGKITAYSDVFRLLPSEIYNIITGKIEIRSLLPDGIPQCSENTVENLVECFSNSLKNMKAHYSNWDVWLALTGGRDSRVTMALLEYAGIPYHTFTLEHSNISEGDISIPKELAKRVDKTNKFIRQEKYDKKRERDYIEHTAGMAVDQGKKFYSYNQYGELLTESPNALVLRSGIWEFATEYYFSGKADCVLTMQDIKKTFPLIRINHSFEQSLSNWFHSVKGDERNNDLSLDERLYWEIRVACWLSTGEQAFDMMDRIDSIQPANSRKLMSMMLAFNIDDRITKKHEDSIIRYACDSIADVPYDTEVKVNAIKKVKKIRFKMHQLLTMISFYGLSKTMDFYHNSLG